LPPSDLAVTKYLSPFFLYETFAVVFFVCADDEYDDNIFALDNYGRALQPAMTKELEDKINRSVSESYNNIKT